MYIEYPNITRCCFCFPLRYGLLVWGYIKLLLQVPLIIYVTVESWNFFVKFNFATVLSFVMLTLIFDVFFSILLVIATHKKNEKLLKLYYVYSLVIAVLFILALLLDLGCTLWLYDSTIFVPALINIVRNNAMVLLALLLLQGYIIFLVRSELMKLRDRSNVQFFNHTSNENEQKVAVNLPEDRNINIES